MKQHRREVWCHAAKEVWRSSKRYRGGSVAGVIADSLVARHRTRKPDTSTVVPTSTNHGSRRQCLKRLRCRGRLSFVRTPLCRDFDWNRSAPPFAQALYFVAWCWGGRRAVALSCGSILTLPACLLACVPTSCLLQAQAAGSVQQFDKAKKLYNQAGFGGT